MKSNQDHQPTYFIDFALSSGLTGKMKYRETYSNKSKMLESLGLFSGAGYQIVDYGEIKEKD